MTVSPKMSADAVAALKAGTPNKLTFRSGADELAALLFVPEGFKAGETYPTVVLVSPGLQVKEQTPALYGAALAKRGYVALGFDPANFGESAGAARGLENPFVKMENTRDAISFLSAQGFVDKARLFGLGVCAGGGTIAMTAVSDKRLKAVASVSGMLANSLMLQGMGKEMSAGVFAMSNASRQEYYETGRLPEPVDFMGLEAELPEGMGPRNARVEGKDFYLTKRGRTERYSHLAPMFSHDSAYLLDASAFASCLYTPFIGVVGEHALAEGDVGVFTKVFYDKCSEPKELVVVPNASHVSLYDIPEDVDAVLKAVLGFFEKHTSA